MLNMSEGNQGYLPETSASVPVKRKRGRPRKYPRTDVDQAGSAHIPRIQNLIHGGNVHIPPVIVGANENHHHQADPASTSSDSMIGQLVHGVVEAAFDAGYLLAVRVGDSDTTLRGVVFKPGHFVPLSARNDVAPEVPMIRRKEVPVPAGNYAWNAYPVSSAGKQIYNGGGSSAPSGSRRGNVVPVVLQPINATNGIAASTQFSNRIGTSKGKEVLHEKMDMLWSFIKSHLNSRILVFLTSCKQVKFVFRAFKALHPGIPLKCLHGRMKQEMRMGVYSQFCQGRSVLFSTDVASRGLDFNKAVDWVVQFDCPDDVASYIHRAGRTARYLSEGKSLLFLMPSEMKMLEKLQEANIPIKLIKPNKKKLQPVSPLMSALLVKDEEMRKLAQRAFITYLRSVHVQKDKEVFDVMKLPIDEFSASMGLPMTPRIRFVKGKLKKKTEFGNSSSLEMDNSQSQNLLGFEDIGHIPQTSDIVEGKSLPEEESDDEILHARDPAKETKVQTAEIGSTMPPTYVSKKKKLKININRPLGTKIVFDDNDLAPTTNSSSLPELGNKDEFYRKLREDMKEADKEDKLAERQRLREKRTKAKSKRKKGMEESEDELSGSEEEEDGGRKRQKVTYSNDDDDEDEMEGSRENVGINSKTLSLKEQEAIALKLLESMHK